MYGQKYAATMLNMVTMAKRLKSRNTNVRLSRGAAGKKYAGQLYIINSKTYDVWFLRVPVFAYSAVGCMEGQNFNATGVLTALSSQQIVECSTPGKNFHLVHL